MRLRPLLILIVVVATVVAVAVAHRGGGDNSVRSWLTSIHGGGGH